MVEVQRSYLKVMIRQFNLTSCWTVGSIYEGFREMIDDYL